MRRAVGSTWIFSLVITFTLIFTGFLSLALNYSKTYKLKNELTLMIEKYQGLTLSDSSKNKTSKLKGSINIMNMYLINNGYVAKGVCKITLQDEENGKKTYGIADLTTNNYELVNLGSKKEYYYCVTIERANKDSCTHIFNVRLFFNFNLPVFGRIRQFSVEGKTNEIYDAYGPITNGVGALCK